MAQVRHKHKLSTAHQKEKLMMLIRNANEARRIFDAHKGVSQEASMAWQDWHNACQLVSNHLSDYPYNVDEDSSELDIALLQHSLTTRFTDFSRLSALETPESNVYECIISMAKHAPLTAPDFVIDGDAHAVNTTDLLLTFFAQTTTAKKSDDKSKSIALISRDKASTTSIHDRNTILPLDVKHKESAEEETPCEDCHETLPNARSLQDLGHRIKTFSHNTYKFFNSLTSRFTARVEEEQIMRHLSLHND